MHVSAYMWKDYSLTYTSVTVTDYENGGASASIDRVEPGYSSDNVGFGLSSTLHEDLFGFSYEIEDPDSGHCQST
jgi:hypothetical protein